MLLISVTEINIVIIILIQSLCYVNLHEMLKKHEVMDNH